MLVTVIIPTGGRPETLFHTLRSCVMQDSERLSVLVADNSRDNQTRDIVESFKDHRISLHRPERRLCMAQNWEFALSHVKKGFCTVIGDDDALLPGSIKRVEEIAEASPDLLVLNHKPGNYHWPDYPLATLQNRLSLPPLDLKFHSENSHAVLTEVCRFQTWYGKLPFLYHGFVSTDHIRRIQARAKKPFFNYCAPDLYSDIVLGMFTGEFLVLGDALTLGGQSGKSNGANFLMRSELGNEFIEELPPELSLEFVSRSFGLAIFDAFNNAIKSFPDQAEHFQVDRCALLRYAVGEAVQLGEPDRGEILHALRRLFRSSDIQAALSEQTQKPSLPLVARIRAKLSRIVKPQRTPPPVAQNKNVGKSPHVADSISDMFRWENGYLQTRDDANLSSFGIQNVCDAAVFLRSVIQNAPNT